MSQLLSIGCWRDLLAMRDLGPLLELILLCLFSVQIKLSKVLLYPVLKCVVFLLIPVPWCCGEVFGVLFWN